MFDLRFPVTYFRTDIVRSSYTCRCQIIFVTQHLSNTKISKFHYLCVGQKYVVGLQIYNTFHTVIENSLKFKLYLFYIDKETIYTTHINHACWHRYLRSGGLCLGGNQWTGNKHTRLTWWPHDHLTCQSWVLNLGRSGERWAHYHYASQT